MTEIEVNKLRDEQGKYLRDESKKTGQAETISFPKSENEVRKAMKTMNKESTPVTVQGSRTGISGGASPAGGHILNLSKMNKITGLRYDPENNCFYLTVQPGVLLSQIREVLINFNVDTTDWTEESLTTLEKLKNSGAYFFPPDPTEPSASIGGMVACNASGARSFYYGPTRNYIEKLKIILTDGSRITLKRGKQQVQKHHFNLTAEPVKAVSNTTESPTCETNRNIRGELPDYQMPDVKNASGYYVKENMDLIDLFIGSEGTLGIIAEIEIRLIPAFDFVWGMVCFFSSEEEALKFVHCVRQIDNNTLLKPIAIEFFNHNALTLLRSSQKAGHLTSSEIPQIKPGYHTAVYIEFHGNNKDKLYDSVYKISEKMVTCGGNRDSTWFAESARDMKRLKEFRHIVPETVNQLIEKRRQQEPGLTKLGTDMAVPDAKLKKVMELYNTGLARTGLESVIFGHIGDNHLHVNILPKTMAEYEKGKELYLQWARKIIAMGGTVSAEHGIGKIKVPFLEEMYGKKVINQMRSLKKLFDPEMILNPGNLLPYTVSFK